MAQFKSYTIGPIEGPSNIDVLFGPSEKHLKPIRPIGIFMLPIFLYSS